MSSGQFWRALPRALPFIPWPLLQIEKVKRKVEGHTEKTPEHVMKSDNERYANLVQQHASLGIRKQVVDGFVREQK